MAVNYGGIAVVATSSARLSQVDFGLLPASFKMLAVRVSVRITSYVSVVIHYPGSDAVSSAFFDDLSDVLERVATLNGPVVIVGDVNVRLDCVDDSNARQFAELLDSYGFA
jgi:exonuclease III